MLGLCRNNLQLAGLINTFFVCYRTSLKFKGHDDMCMYKEVKMDNIYWSI